MTAIPWREEPMVLVCAPAHELAKQRAVSIKQLHGQKLVGFNSDLTIRREIDRVLHLHRVEVQVVMEFDNIETIKRSVEIGAGVSIVPLLTVQKEVQSGALVQVHFTDKNFYRQLGIIVRSKQPLTPAARKFIELMQNPPKSS